MNVRKKQFETSWSLLLIWTLSVLIAVASFRFLVAELAVVMPHMLHHAMARPISLYLHIGLAPVVLLLLPIQFSQKIRNQRPKLHRWCGRLYAVFILFAGVSGLVLGLTTEAGPIAATGFVFGTVLGVDHRQSSAASHAKTDCGTSPLDDPISRTYLSCSDFAILRALRGDFCGI